MDAVESLLGSPQALEPNSVDLVKALRKYLVVADPIFTRGYDRLQVAYEHLSKLVG